MSDRSSTLGPAASWANDETWQNDTCPPLGFGSPVSHLLVRVPLIEVSKTATASSASPGLEQTLGFPESANPRVPRAKRINPHPEDRYILLKKYEGVVTSRTDHSFTARLTENASDYPILEAEFDLEELSETDQALAVEGAALVWTIGYGYAGGTRRRESAIYLRRLPPWSQEELDQSRRAVDEMMRDIAWE